VLISPNDDNEEVGLLSNSPDENQSRVSKKGEKVEASPMLENAVCIDPVLSPNAI
jgi:hypothetical protein